MKYTIKEFDMKYTIFEELCEILEPCEEPIKENGDIKVGCTTNTYKEL